jgi:hypothetical protein
MRLLPIEAAKKFVEQFLPNCSVAFLAGSTSRGEHKENSDLDIVIIDDTQPSAYRESFFEFGWRIEAFIHTKESYPPYFESDRKRGRPTLPNMFVSGIVLKDDGSANVLKQEAKFFLDKGPDPLTFQDIQASRYFLSDLLEDFVDAEQEDEALITLNTLSIQLAEFILRVHGQWVGRGKGLIKAFKLYDEHLCQRFIDSQIAFYKYGDKEPFVQFFDEMLELFGGRLFEGFSMGKPDKG